MSHTVCKSLVRHPLLLLLTASLSVPITPMGQDAAPQAAFEAGRSASGAETRSVVIHSDISQSQRTTQEARRALEAQRDLVNALAAARRTRLAQQDAVPVSSAPDEGLANNEHASEPATGFASGEGGESSVPAFDARAAEAELTRQQAAAAGVVFTPLADGSYALTVTGKIGTELLTEHVGRFLPPATGFERISELTLRETTLIRITFNFLTGFNHLRTVSILNNQTLRTIESEWLEPCKAIVERVHIEGAPSLGGSVPFPRTECTALKELIIRHTALRDALAINHLRALRIVDLSHNELTALPLVNNLSLSYYNVSNNNIEGNISSEGFPAHNSEGEQSIVLYTDNENLGGPERGSWNIGFAARENAYIEFTGTRAELDETIRAELVKSDPTDEPLRRRVKDGVPRGLTFFKHLPATAKKYMERCAARGGAKARARILANFTDDNACYKDALAPLLVDRRSRTNSSKHVSAALWTIRNRKKIAIGIGVVGVAGIVFAAHSAAAAAAACTATGAGVGVATGTAAAGAATASAGAAAGGIGVGATIGIGVACLGIAELIPLITSEAIAGKALLNIDSDCFILPCDNKKDGVEGIVKEVMLSNSCTEIYHAAAKLYGGYLLCSASLEQLRVMQLIAEFLKHNDLLDFAKSAPEYQALLRTIASDTGGLVLNQEEAGIGVHPVELIRMIQSFSNETNDLKLMRMVATEQAYDDSDCISEVSWNTAHKRVHAPDDTYLHWLASFRSIRAFIVEHGHLLRGDREKALEFLTILNEQLKPGKRLHTALTHLRGLYGTAALGEYGRDIITTVDSMFTTAARSA